MGWTHSSRHSSLHWVPTLWWKLPDLHLCQFGSFRWWHSDTNICGKAPLLHPHTFAPRLPKQKGFSIRSHEMVTVTSVGFPIIPASPPATPAHAIVEPVESFPPALRWKLRARISYNANLAVEYVVWRRIEAESPDHSDRIPISTWIWYLSGRDVTYHLGLQRYAMLLALTPSMIGLAYNYGMLFWDQVIWWLSSLTTLFCLMGGLFRSTISEAHT